MVPRLHSHTESPSVFNTQDASPWHASPQPGSAAERCSSAAKRANKRAERAGGWPAGRISASGMNTLADRQSIFDYSIRLLPQMTDVILSNGGLWVWPYQTHVCWQ
eukprot:3710345-Rhodomonas_salina.1